MAPRLAHDSSLKAVSVHAPRGASYVVFALLALMCSLVGRWVVSTVGEPYRQTVEQNERIQATAAVVEGMDERNLLALQRGVERAAECKSFNETLLDEGEDLHRKLSRRINKLTEAVSAGDASALVVALEAAIELHSDGRPIVDRRHLRAAAKKLQEVEKAGAKEKAAAAVPEPAVLESVYGRVKAAIDLSRDLEDSGERLEEEEKKLPSKWLPSFWATCRCAS